VRRAAAPERGDLVWLSLSPRAEQAASIGAPGTAEPAGKASPGAIAEVLAKLRPLLGG
jgi:hypothetical protein